MTNLPHAAAAVNPDDPSRLSGRGAEYALARVDPMGRAAELDGAARAAFLAGYAGAVRARDDDDRDALGGPSESDRLWWMAASDLEAPEPATLGQDLADYLDDEAAWYEDMESDHARWLGRQIRELASMARFLHARTGDAYDDRAEVMERGIREVG